jgi:hypothetical protein
VARKRSEPKLSKEDREKLKRITPDQWKALEKRVSRQGPSTGLGLLQERGGRGVDKAARTIVSSARAKK